MNDNAKKETAKPFSVSRADEYVKENAKSVVQKYRPTYHALPPVGWMNDPNGLSFAFGKYHMFFQFHPYSSFWGPMHWGHYVTDDFVNWEWKGTALAPDESYDKDGVFSGSSVEKDGKQYLFYTAVSDGFQTQAAALSSGGVRYEKLGVVIPTSALPENCTPNDFRDPYVFSRDGKYYMLCGSKATDGDGQILLFSSADLKKWTFVGVVIKDGKTTRGIYECPCYLRLDGKDVILSSPQGYLTDDWRYENDCSSVYFVGSLDVESGKMTVEREDEIDGGFNFYAPQAFVAPDGRAIMIAWMTPVGYESPASNDGWKCAMTLPRELFVKNGRLYQSPVREIERFRTNAVKYERINIEKETRLAGVCGTKIELIVEISVGDAQTVGLRLFESADGFVTLYFSKKDKKVVFDCSDSGMEIPFRADGKKDCSRSVKVDSTDLLSLRIFLDVSCAEIFINGGERTLTSQSYVKGNGSGISFFSDGTTSKILSLEKFDVTPNR